MQRFKALVASKGDAGQSLAWQELGEGDLMEGDVLVRVSHSTVNYKDGLALTGKAPVIRRWPMIPGIDFAGTVVVLRPCRFQARRRGDPERLGRGRDAFRRLRADGARQGRLAGARCRAASRPPRAWRSAPPATRRCCACWRWSGTASTPASGPVLVTGAAGGVGSVAIALLAKLGYQVIASTGRTAEADYLKGLGAAEIIDRAELAGKPPAAQQGALGRRRRCGRQPHARQRAEHDQVRRHGRRLRPGAGHGPAASVAPFILRGVTLAGIDSVMAPKPLRVEAWRRLAPISTGPSSPP